MVGGTVWGFLIAEVRRLSLPFFIAVGEDEVAGFFRLVLDEFF